MSEEDVLLNRRAKMEAVGKSVYRNDFRRQALATRNCKSVRRAGQSGTGRSQRAHGGGSRHAACDGKASFVTLQDVSGQIQCYLTKNDLGDDEYEDFPSSGRWAISSGSAVH